MRSWRSRLRQSATRMSGLPITRVIMGLDSGLELAERLCGLGFARETFPMTPEEKVWHGLLPALWLDAACRKLRPPAARAAGVGEARG